MRILTGDFILETMRGRKGAAHSAFRAVLRALSLFYGVAVRLRNAAYSAGLLSVHRTGCPVISVGNLTAGGTGKTPAVEYLSRALVELGRKPAVLSRGFGAKTPQGVSDEIASMGRDIKVYASPDRLRSARCAMADGADCLLLDDGFQHRGLNRQLDILLLDSLDPWGRGRLLPAGFLREPLSSARRADLVILTRSDLVGSDRRKAIEAKLRKAGVRADILRARHAPDSLAGDLAGPPDSLHGMPTFLFSGVGNPEGFKGTAASLGIEVQGETAFPDHHDYMPADMKDLTEKASKHGAKLLLTTRKDWVKVKDFPRGAMPLSALQIRFEMVSGEERLKEMIASALKKAGKG